MLAAVAARDGFSAMLCTPMFDQRPSGLCQGQNRQKENAHARMSKSYLRVDRVWPRSYQSRLLLWRRRCSLSYGRLGTLVRRTINIDNPEGRRRMDAHKYRIGQFVAYRSPGVDAPRGDYVIIARLPQCNDGGLEYRIKHSPDLHQRNAKESKLRLK